MKKYVYSVLALLTVLACSQNTVKYDVKGTGPEDGAKVLLIDQITSEPIDSAVVSSGVFQIFK